MLVRIRFTNVGRDKKTWEENIPRENGLIDDIALIKSVKKNGGLASRGIVVTDGGEILVGGFRCVGKWEVV